MITIVVHRNPFCNFKKRVAGLKIISKSLCQSNNKKKKRINFNHCSIDVASKIFYYHILNITMVFCQNRRRLLSFVFLHNLK